MHTRTAIVTMVTSKFFCAFWVKFEFFHFWGIFKNFFEFPSILVGDSVNLKSLVKSNFDEFKIIAIGTNPILTNEACYV